MAEEITKLVEELLVGDIVARPVYTKNGTSLLDVNFRLTAEYIEKLERWGIASIFVLDPESETSEERERMANRRAADHPAAHAADPPSAVGPGVSAATAAGGGTGEPIFKLGTLEAEEPISWDEIGAALPNSRSLEEVSAELEAREVVRPPVHRTAPEPPKFHYDKSEVAEAKKIVHEIHTTACASK